MYDKMDQMGDEKFVAMQRKGTFKRMNSVGEMNTQNTENGEEEDVFDAQEEEGKKKKEKKVKKKFEGHKFENIDAHSYDHILKVHPLITYDKELCELSKQALVDKGMNNYLESIPKDMISTRVQYGFIGKRSTGKIKYF